MQKIPGEQKELNISTSNILSTREEQGQHETPKKEEKIYNEYDDESFMLSKKIFVYGYIPISVAILALYLMLKIGIVFVGFSIVSYILALIYYFIQTFRSISIYGLKNKNCNVWIKKRNLAGIFSMIWILYITKMFLPHVGCCKPTYVCLDIASCIILLSFLTQFLYNKNFGQFDFIFIIYLIIAISTPYVMYMLGFKIPVFFRTYSLFISGLFVIMATILNHKRPRVTNKGKIQVVLIMVLLFIIAYDIYNYGSLLDKQYKLASAKIPAHEPVA